MKNVFVLFLLLLSFSSESFGLVLGIYHPNPNLHPHYYLSSKDQFVLSLLSLGCSPKRYHLKKFKTLWNVRLDSHKIDFSLNNASHQVLLKSWDTLQNQQFHNPRRIVLKRFLQNQNFKTIFKKQQIQIFSEEKKAYLFTTPLLSLDVKNQILFYNSISFRAQSKVLLRKNEKCIIQSFSTQKALIHAFQQRKIQGFFISRQFQKLEELPKNISKKAQSMGGNQLVYFRFGGKLLAKKNELIQQAITHVLPTKKFAKNNLFLNATKSFIPSNFKLYSSRSNYRLYNTRWARVLLWKWRKKKLKPFQIRIGYIDDPLFRQVAIMFANAVKTTLKFHVEVERISIVESLKKSQEMDIVIGYADLDSGELIELWQKVKNQWKGKQQRKRNWIDYRLLYPKLDKSRILPLFWIERLLYLRSSKKIK
ncbi:MAG: hypothetical protein ACI86H_000296 [bacterium]|jgi:hypothetical protein